MLKRGTASTSGFTLIEILIVIVVIGILAAVALPRFAGRTKDARLAAATSDVKSTVALALDTYEIDNGRYPTTDQGLAALVRKPTLPPVPKRWKGPYLQRGMPKDPWGKPYKYVCPGRHNKNGYDLSCSGPDEVEGTDDDIVNWQNE